jgi:hypothetical protein
MLKGTRAGTYASDFYAGRPALTVNNFGQVRHITSCRTKKLF